MHKNGVIREFERRVKQGTGKLTKADALELVRRAYHEGLLEQNELRALALIYERKLDLFDREGTDLLADFLQATGAAKSPQPDQVPDPDAAQRDARLIGKWIYSKYYRSGRFSGSHHQWMVLGGDGSFSRGEDAHGRWATL